LGYAFKTFCVDLHISLLETGTGLNRNHPSLSCLDWNVRLRNQVCAHFSKQTYLIWKFIASVPDIVVWRALCLHLHGILELIECLV